MKENDCEKDRQHLFDVSCDTHRQRTHSTIGIETNHVQKECQDTIGGQPYPEIQRGTLRRWRGMKKMDVHLTQLAREIRQKCGLNERQRR